MNYDSYLLSDEGGKQFMMRQLFHKLNFLEQRNIALELQNQQLTLRVEALEKKPNHLKLIENKGRYPPQILHIIYGKMSEKP